MSLLQPGLRTFTLRPDGSNFGHRPSGTRATAQGTSALTWTAMTSSPVSLTTRAIWPSTRPRSATSAGLSVTDIGPSRVRMIGSFP